MNVNINSKDDQNGDIINDILASAFLNNDNSNHRSNINVNNDNNEIAVPLNKQHEQIEAAQPHTRANNSLNLELKIEATLPIVDQQHGDQKLGVEESLTTKSKPISQKQNEPKPPAVAVSNEQQMISNIMAGFKSAPPPSILPSTNIDSMIGEIFAKNSPSLSAPSSTNEEAERTSSSNSPPTSVVSDYDYYDSLNEYENPSVSPSTSEHSQSNNNNNHHRNYDNNNNGNERQNIHSSLESSVTYDHQRTSSSSSSSSSSPAIIATSNDLQRKRRNSFDDMTTSEEESVYTRGASGSLRQLPTTASNTSNQTSNTPQSKTKMVRKKDNVQNHSSKLQLEVFHTIDINPGDSCFDCNTLLDSFGSFSPLSSLFL